MISQITIIGVGLIGGSLARALRRKNYCQTIIGYGQKAEHLRLAQSLGVIDHYETNLEKAVERSELVVVAVPVRRMASVFQQLALVLKDDVVVTDVGSVKGTVVNDARSAFGSLKRFIPAHPIAGTEKSGVAASIANLFEHHNVILTPAAENDQAALQIVTDMWAATGAQVIQMEVVHHDEILAATSHLPHILAFNLVECLARMHQQREIFKFAAGGFRDFTRIASSDPSMWVDISLANSEAILAVLKQYRLDLDRLILAITNNDEIAIQTIYKNAKIARDQYCCV